MKILTCCLTHVDRGASNGHARPPISPCIRKYPKAVLAGLLLAVAASCDRDSHDVASERQPNIAEVRHKAEGGDATAQKDLGAIYAKGLGVEQDYREAAKWYQLAAAQGNPAAQTALGELCEVGQGVPRNEAEGAKWYRKAAEQGYAPAQYNLAVLLTVGRGVPMNVSEALKWYRAAADQGDPLAQYNLGMRHFEGKGVPRDPIMAYVWLSRAAANKLSDATAALEQLRPTMTQEQITEGKRRAVEPLPAKTP